MRMHFTDRSTYYNTSIHLILIRSVDLWWGTPRNCAGQMFADAGYVPTNSLNFGSLYLVMFPCTSMCGSDIHYSQSIRYPQLSPSLSSCTPRISARVHQDKQLPYHTTLHGFGFHHIITFARSIQLQSYPRPPTSTSSWFLFHTYSVRVVNFVCPHISQFSSLILRPGTSACFFSQPVSVLQLLEPLSTSVHCLFVFVCSSRDAAAHQRHRTTPTRTRQDKRWRRQQQQLG